MKRAFLFLTVILSFFWLSQGGGAGCSSSSDDTGGGSESESDETPGDEAIERSFLDQAMEALQARDISGAKDLFEQALTLNANDSKAHFGVALTRMLRLPDTESIIAIQDGLGQTRFSVSNVVGSGSYFEELEQYNNGTRDTRPSTDRFPRYKSPVYNGFGVDDILYLAQNGFTSSTAQGHIATAISEFDTVISHLDLARADSEFQFTVPKELYYSNLDIEVSHADLTLLTSSFYFSRMGLYFSGVWTFDTDLGRLYNANGTPEMSAAERIVDFNRFFRIRSMTALTSARSDMLNGLTRALEGFDELPTAEGFGVFERISTTEAGLNELRGLAQALSDSLGGVQTVPGAIPVTTIDLSVLFSDPPDLDEIGIDPFVLEFGRVKLVEAFFQSMINKVLTGVTIGMDSYQILASLSSSFAPNLFNEFSEMMVGGELIRSGSSSSSTTSEAGGT